MIITFSGTDGSGKSTQIEILMSEFIRQGFRVKYVWSRGGYTPLFSALKKILRILTAKRLPNEGNSSSRDELLKNKSVSGVWLTIATLDLLMFYGVYVRIMSWFGMVVVCDRYIEDTLIDFKRNFPDTFDDQSFLWRLLVLFIPRPNQSFLLFVPVDVSLIRSKMKGEPFPDTPETLAFRLKAYLDESIFPSDKYHKIDCQKSIEIIQTEIAGKFKELS
jgi:thymidylate kinase